MISLFASLKSLLKAPNSCIDGLVFRLHYRYTVLILLCASILLSCNQYFGEPIYCVESNGKSLKGIFLTYCWIHSTFTLPHAWNLTVGSHVPYPGIDRHVPGERRTFHAYYQWVSLVLLLQGIFFYLPRYMWKVWENGMIKELSLNLQYPLLSPSESSESYKLLSHALHTHWGHFSGYFAKYIFCELLTLVNVIGQMLFLDTFLDGAFSTFGFRVIQWSEWDQEYRTDPLVKAFPRMTKCQFHHFGYGGDVNRLDALCILPLNILNEKIFIFLWFWMMLLSSLTSLVLAYRLFLTVMPHLRYIILITRATHASKSVLDRLVNSSKMSDWFVLYLLSKNIDALHYRIIIGKLDAAIRGVNIIEERELSSSSV